nr:MULTISPECIES: VCBS repeat-containing protein [unclassified Streptomyces]
MSTGWTGKTLTDAGTISNAPALWSRDDTTGELDLYTGTPTIPAAPPADAVPAIPAGSSTSTKTVVATSGWSKAIRPQLFPAGDSNGDGRPDLWATDIAPVRNVSYYGSTTTAFATPTHAQTLNPTGDINGDGEADILAIDTSGNQWIYPGSDGIKTSSFLSRYQTGSGWSGMDALNISDINGDGRPDILTRRTSDASLWVYPGTGGTGTSTFGAPYKVGDSWGGMNIIEVGDVNGDGKTDILARRASDNSLLTYPGTGGTGINSFSAPYLVGDSWGGMNIIRLGDINGDGKTDIFCIDAAGTQYVYPGTGGAGTSTFGTRYQTGTGWNITNSISLSDVNSDGKIDILSRLASDSSLWTYPGTGGTGTSTFDAAYKVGASWGGMTVII